MQAEDPVQNLEQRRKKIVYAVVLSFAALLAVSMLFLLFGEWSVTPDSLKTHQPNVQEAAQNPPTDTLTPMAPAQEDMVGEGSVLHPAEVLDLNERRHEKAKEAQNPNRD